MVAIRWAKVHKSFILGGTGFRGILQLGSKKG